MTQPTLNLKTAPSHVVLAAAGKTVLRPGGRAATEQLFQWANFQPGETVLELASGLGASAIALAKRYNVQVLGIENDADRVAIAQANARSAGLEHLVRFLEGNIFQLETLSESFDYVLAEAILSMQSPAGKAKILAGARDRLKAIHRIKKILGDRPRDLCLFTLGINTAYRANELLSLKVGQVKNLRAGDVLDLKQRKTHKYRPVTLNPTAITAIQNWLAIADLKSEDYLFTGQRGCLTVETMSTRVKTWCHDVGLKGNYGSHTLRKTWGYWQRLERGTAVPLLMEAFGHATQQQTLAYLGIQSNEIAAIYELEL